MAQSAHAYVRGSTAKFYEWLDEPSPALNYPKALQSGFAATVTSAISVPSPTPRAVS